MPPGCYEGFLARGIVSHAPARFPLAGIDREHWHHSRAVQHIADHGLHGAQLEYKLQLVEYASQKAAEERANPRPFWAWKTKLIDLIDNLLVSIFEGTPGSGATRELKDTLKGARATSRLEDGKNELSTPGIATREGAVYLTQGAR